MRKTKSRVPMLLIALMLGSLITWAPPIAAEGNPSDPVELQAQNINAIFDSQTESTTVQWNNEYDIEMSFSLLQQMQQSRYLVYRDNVPLNASVVANLNPWANVSMCPVGVNIGDCNGMSFQETYPLPAGTNDTYYYAIVTYFENNDDADPTNDYEYTLNEVTYSPTHVGNYVHGEANVSEGIAELTNDITAPFFVQANFIPTIGDSNNGATDISWVNLNTIVPDSLPEVGEAAYEIRIYRHEQPALRETWATMEKTEIAQLDAGETTYRYMLEADTDEFVYYSVTYLYLGYEDARFLGTNTLVNSIHEDNVAPGSVQGVVASFAAEPAGGTGNTTISWLDIESEVGETYQIWRSGTPINNTSAPGVELIGTAIDEEGSYIHEVERGMLGLAYYAVTAYDTNGNHDNIVSSGSTTDMGIEEDTFTPWVAEPTNVYAEYIGGGQTTISWTDQLGVEGEQYHVWRSSVRLTSLANLELVAELVATVPDSVETVTVSIEDNIDEPKYYCVSSVARYSLSSDVYEDLRFLQNCYGPIDEDTLRPSLAFLQDAYMTDQGGSKITLLRWVNDLTESEETYQIWMNEDDPFDGDENIMSGDIALEDGWIPILDPIVAQSNNVPDFTRAISLPENLDKSTWYAITTTDKYGNENTQYSMAMNARSVVEDTTPPELTLAIENEDGIVVDSLRAGDYRLYIYSNEPLSEYPILNLRTTDYAEDENGLVISGTAFTEQSSTVRAQPLQGSVENAYRYNFEVTDDIDTSEILATLEIRDVSQNVLTIDIAGWSIDSQNPILEVYAPSQESLYLYGEQIHVYGAVSDDVGIDSVEIQFRYYQNGIMKETEWTAMTDLTTPSTSNNTVVFEWWEPSATFHDLGKNQKVTIRATDTSGNQREWFTQFTVDSCIRTFAEYGDACAAGTIAVEPEPEPEIEPEGYYDGAYLMVYGLAAFNVILLILTIMSVLLSSPERKKKEDSGDEDDWMREFMGGGENAAGSPDDVRSDMASLSEDATERADAEDPFAKSEGRDRKRKTTKKTKKIEVEEVVEDNDEFDDEDDDWDDDSGPKKKSERKSVKRRSLRRK